MTTVKDNDLIEQTLNGNRHAFRFLVLRYECPVFKIVSTLVRNNEKIEDIAQETFLRAYKSLHRYDASKGASFSTWLFTIARNLCFNELRKQRLREEGADISAQRSTGSLDSEKILERAEQADMVRAAIEKLPVAFRNAVVLSCFKEHSTKEIADIEGCSEGTVKSRIFRGKKMLYGYLKPLLGD